jgi:hypothetical protein
MLLHLEVSIPQPKGCTKHTWFMCGAVRKAVILRTPEGGRLVRPVQLVIPLEVDQGGEDVEDITD